ncbi:MAG: endonuclease/exonuclease/phosphatase family protein [Bdellovibrionota bacterium]
MLNVRISKTSKTLVALLMGGIGVGFGLLGMAKSKLHLNTVSVMTYNVENLFDTTHDRGKTDYTFLPLEEKKTKEHKQTCLLIKVKKWRDECLDLDWSEKQLQQKLENLRSVILSVNQGRGPDVLVLQEVENEIVLRRLAKIMPEANYQEFVLIEGNDIRGIDVAMLSRLPLKKPAILHEIPFENMKSSDRMDTRGILEANFDLGNQQTLTVYGVHFPAPYHDRTYRLQALERLAMLRNQHAKNHLVIAAGDFNITSDEDEKYNPLSVLGEEWKASHKIKTLNHEGTNYYPPKKNWSYLDMMLFSQAWFDRQGWELNVDSVRVIDQAVGQVDSQGRPNRFDPTKGEGVSDHLPIFAYLQLKSAL